MFMFREGCIQVVVGQKLLRICVCLLQNKQHTEHSGEGQIDVWSVTDVLEVGVLLYAHGNVVKRALVLACRVTLPHTR